MDAETAKNSGIPPQYLHELPNGTWVHRGMFNTFGPGANCTLDLCPVEWSLFQYRPSLAANAFFIAFFSVAVFVHLYLGIRWRVKGFTIFMVLGCAYIAIGYGGRILLWQNPWSFAGFMLQIIAVGSGPVFFTAAIYVTLARATRFFAPEISRLPTRVYYWIFISIDSICLVLQAAGGALSTTSNGSSQAGVDLARAGLIIQVISIGVFCGFFIDYMIRFNSLRKIFPDKFRHSMGQRQIIFFVGLAGGIILILARCIYRVDELSEGYSNSKKLTNETLFIVLEGVLIALAVICLSFGHPGVGFGRNQKRQTLERISDSSHELT